MTKTEAPLRLFLQEGKAVEHVVDVAIARQEVGCPCVKDRALFARAVSCSASGVVHSGQSYFPSARQESRRIALLVAQDFPPSSGSRRHPPPAGAGPRPPVSANVVAFPGCGQTHPRRGGFPSETRPAPGGSGRVGDSGGPRPGA